MNRLEIHALMDLEKKTWGLRACVQDGVITWKTFTLLCPPWVVSGLTPLPLLSWMVMEALTRPRLRTKTKTTF